MMLSHVIIMISFLVQFDDDGKFIHLRAELNLQLCCCQMPDVKVLYKSP